MALLSWAFRQAEVCDSEIPEIFPLSVQKDFFIKADIFATYLKILTDTMERVHGLPDALHSLLWDSCVQSDAGDGLITLLARAMTEQRDLFIVYKPSLDVLRIADAEEERQIRQDYKENGESPVGVFISFKKYRRTEMLAIYSAFEFCTLSSLNKSLNLARAIQLKINELRNSVSMKDSAVAKVQAQGIAAALRHGNDVLLDGKDIIETAKVDTAPTEKAIGFISYKKADITALPVSYISGIQTPGIGSTGEADMRAVERGLKQYFVSILQPVFLAIFDEETTFQSLDFREMTTALEVVKIFELVGEENISSVAKRDITARVFGLDPEEEAKNLEADRKKAEAEALANPPPPASPPDPNAPPPGNQPPPKKVKAA